MGKRHKRFTLFLPLVLFVILVCIFYQLLKNKDYDPASLPSALIGNPFPAFFLSELVNEERITAPDIVGEPMLVNIWATWCIACKVEHAFLNQLKEQGIRIVGVDYKDDRHKAIAWLKTLGNPYAVVISDPDGNLGLDLGVYGAPETFFVDAKGNIQYRFVGVIDQSVWDQQLKSIFIGMKDKP